MILLLITISSVYWYDITEVYGNMSNPIVEKKVRERKWINTETASYTSVISYNESVKLLTIGTVQLMFGKDRPP